MSRRMYGVMRARLRSGVVARRGAGMRRRGRAPSLHLIISPLQFDTPTLSAYNHPELETNEIPFEPFSFSILNVRSFLSTIFFSIHLFIYIPYSTIRLHFLTGKYETFPELSRQPLLQRKPDSVFSPLKFIFLVA